MTFWEWLGFANPRDAPKTIEQPKEGLPQVTDNVRDSGQTFVFGRSNAGEQVDEKAASTPVLVAKYYILTRRNRCTLNMVVCSATSVESCLCLKAPREFLRAKPQL